MKPQPASDNYAERFRKDGMADVLEFGRLLHRYAVHPDVFDNARNQPLPTKNDILKAEKALLWKLHNDPDAVVTRKLIVGHTETEKVDPLHLRILALLAYRGLMLPCTPMRTPEMIAETAGLGDMAVALECRRKIATLLYQHKLTLEDGEYGGAQVSLNFGFQSYFCGGHYGMARINQKELRDLWGWREKAKPSDEPAENEKTEPPEKKKSVRLLTASEIYGRLCLRVIGQEQLKRALAVAGRTILLRMRQVERGAREDELIGKPNVCIIGPSGSGKTLATLALARILDIPYGALDLASVTASGYVGDDVSGVLYLIYRMAQQMKRNPDKGALVLLDEADKLASTFASSSATTTGPQAETLRLLDGLPVSFSPRGLNKWGPRAAMMNTSNMLVVCSGAWTWLEDELRGTKRAIGFAEGGEVVCPDVETSIRELLVSKGGLLPEIVNRFGTIVRTSPPSEDDLVAVLESPLGPLEEYKRLFRVNRRSLTLDPLAARAIARWSIQHELNGRGPRAGLDRILRDTLFEGRPTKFKITKKMVIEVLGH